MENLFVVDASGYLYSAYFAIRNMTNSKGESTNALFGFIRSIAKIRKDFNPTHLVAVFDGPNNAKKRIEMYSAYKAHRQETPQDLRYQIDRAKTFCTLMGIPFISVPEVEADDTMGAIAVQGAALGIHVYLCSSDKDLCQLVNDNVSILNTNKDNLIIGPQQVEEIHGIPPRLMIDYLAIVGDASDNVPGLPGFGPKTAAKLLHKFGSLDAILDNPSAITEPKKQETIIQQADLARLSRKLVTIDTSIEIPFENLYYSLATPQYPELQEFFREMNFKSLLKDLESQTTSISLPAQTPSQEAVITEYHLVDDEESFVQLVNHLSKETTLALNLITTHSVPFKAGLVGIAFGVLPGKAWYVPANGSLGLERVLQGIKPLLENPAIGCYGHNFKSHMQILAHHDIDIANVGFDTLLASFLLDSHSRQHSMDALILEHFGKVKTNINALLGKGKTSESIDKIEPAKISDFCCEEVDYIVRLKLLLEKQIVTRNLTKLFYELELPLTRVLASVERYGLFLDVDFLKTLSEKINLQIEELRNDIFGLAGEEFNLNSPKQLITIFEKLKISSGKKTPTGQMKLDSDVLDALSEKYPIASKVLEYRGVEKLRSTYVDTLPLEINLKSGRIHCTFNQSIAATGRLSCQDPNLQNIPVRTELGRQMRQAFCPQRQGWSYLAADYSQIELRLLAHFSEDPNLLRAFHNNEDIHAYTASLIFNIPLHEVSKELRQNAKAVNFGIIYGQQAFGLSQELQIDVKTAAEFIEKYFDRYPRVRDFVEGCKELARTTGKTVTLTGRERQIPEILSKNMHLRSAAERLAVNTPLQGTAADLIKMAMLKIASELPFPLRPLCPPSCGGMVLQIHDELIFEVPDNAIEKTAILVRRAMEEVVQLKVPLIVDVMVGKNWKEC
ncbi:MAG: DNA polymerase I [Parachlamydiaceae bacterium]|nr:DNA polymerase I [Parachlamydiaceae bacterium]